MAKGLNKLPTAHLCLSVGSEIFNEHIDHLLRMMSQLEHCS